MRETVKRIGGQRRGRDITRWYLQFELLILLLFTLGLLRLTWDKRVFIGMNRRFVFPNIVHPDVFRSARKAIAEDVSWKIRYRWWRQEHPRLRRYCLPILIFCLSCALGMPVLLGAEVTIDNDANFAGLSDYDCQIATNTSNDYAVIYGRDQGISPERVSVRYSQDGGSTWSSRIILFSTAAQGDGIIDDDVGGMWEYSCQVLNDVWYITLHLKPGGTTRIGFMKCDISNITNIGTYSNWKSADGTAVPVSGGGSDGNGFDLVMAQGYIDPSIGVQGSNNILITVVVNPPIDDKIYGSYYDGGSWSGLFTLKQVTTDVTAVSNTRYMEDGDWVVSIKMGADSIVLRCDSGDDPTVAANWTGMDGAGNFDFAISQGAYSFYWPTIQVDSENRVHVASITVQNIDGFKRIYHNYWVEGVGWNGGEAEDNAGTRVGGDDPKLTGTPVLGMDADSGGNIIMLFPVWDNGGETRSLFWKDSTMDWDFGTYTTQSSSRRLVVQEGYMRGVETVAPFLVSSEAGNAVYFIGVSGAESGSPWWEAVPSAGQKSYNLGLTMIVSKSSG